MKVKKSQLRNYLGKLEGVGEILFIQQRGKTIAALVPIQPQTAEQYPQLISTLKAIEIAEGAAEEGVSMEEVISYLKKRIKNRR